MNSLDRKLFRDLWKMRGQALAIILVVLSGIAAYVMLVSTMDSLELTRERYYRDYGFADVFAPLKRAPEEVAAGVRRIPGVDRAETRVVADIKLRVEGFDEPVTAKAVSLPYVGEPHLDRLHLRSGRLPGARSPDEAVISDSFAKAQDLKEGDGFGAVINGRWRRLTVTGVALSPEFVLQVRPGAISPDFKRYGIIWMGREALEAAYGMKGAFNDLALTLVPGAKAQDVITALDGMLGRYGGLGAYARADQISNRYLTEEFKQLKRSSRIFPAVFIAVAAFLLNVVITRTVNSQRDIIATLKAFGYNRRVIALHYLKLVSIIVLAGSIAGIALGAWLGVKLAAMYMKFYRFPSIDYVLSPMAMFAPVAITAASVFAGTLRSVMSAAAMPPAEAMMPERPAVYRRSVFEYIRVWNLLAQPTRIIIRNIERRPVKSLLTMTGIALSCGTMVAGTFARDSIKFMVDVQFKMTHKEDMSATFVEPAPARAVYELMGVQGIWYAEGYRTVPVKLKSGPVSYRTTVTGIKAKSRLYDIMDKDLRPVEVPPSGIVLTDYLGKILNVKPGDMITVEALEGKKTVRQVQVAMLARQYVGVNGYMEIDALNRLMGEGPAVSGAYLAIDPLYQARIYEKLVEMPKVAGAVVRRQEIKNFYSTQAEALLFFIFISSILGGTIAFGVVYNSARINLSERGRELASLRVLGYTRAEISYILLGELALHTIVAIPVGFLIGRGIAAYIAQALSSDLFRVPVVVQPTTYSLAAAVVFASACLSALIVRHRLDHLDLVGVLKTRE